MLYKYPLAIFCKTCYRDIENLKLLLSSIEKYNIDKIPVVLCISSKEKGFLKEVIESFSQTMVVFYDEDIYKKEYNNEDKFLKDWIYQQLVKMNFYKTNFAKHYLLIDSDCYFIRDFFVRNFLYDNETPYFPLTGHTKGERFPLSLVYKNDSTFYNKGEFADFLGDIRTEITLDMPFVLSSDYMYFFEAYLKNRNYSFEDILKIKPNEMQWYLEFCVHNNLKYRYTTSFFLPFHIEVQYQILGGWVLMKNLLRKII